MTKFTLNLTIGCKIYIFASTLINFWLIFFWNVISIKKYIRCAIAHPAHSLPPPWYVMWNDLRLIGRELFLWLGGDEGPWFESDDELLLFSGSDSTWLFGSQICSSDELLDKDVCLLLDGLFSMEEFDEISILLPATLSAPEVVEDAEAEAGWRFSTFSASADASNRFFRETGFG